MICGEKDPKNFHGRSKSRCKKCQGSLNEHARIERRNKAIELKGGKCEHCGYGKYRGALEFHHVDPKSKDLKNFKSYSMERVLKELEKCILLCANCHREKHAKLW